MSKTTEFVRKLNTMLNSRITPWVSTSEEERFLKLLRRICQPKYDNKKEFHILSWSISEGLLDIKRFMVCNASKQYETPTPVERVDIAGTSLPAMFSPISTESLEKIPVVTFKDTYQYIMENSERHIYIFKDLHNFFAKNSRNDYPDIVRRLRDLIFHLRANGGNLLFLSPEIQLPLDLMNDIHLLPMPRPDDADIETLLDIGLAAMKREKPSLEFCINYKDEKGKLVKSKNKDAIAIRQKFLYNLRGLTETEIVQIISYATVKNLGLDENALEDITESKRDKIAQFEALEFVPTPENSVVGGHSSYKNYIDQRGLFLNPQIRDQYNLKPPKGTLVVGIPGCQPAGSKVLMSTGEWKNIENIVIGDEIISPQKNNCSQIATVIDLVSLKNRPVYKVKTIGLRKQEISFFCSDNHTLVNRVIKQKKVNNKNTYLSLTEEIVVEEFLKKGAAYKNKSKLITTPAYELQEKKHLIHPYVLGCMLGDGSLKYHPGITCHQNNFAIIKKMVRHGAIFGAKNSKKGQCFNFNTNGLFTKLIKNSEIYGLSSHQKYIPKEYKLGSLSQRLELLAGLIDTDGTKNEFSTVSLQLAKDFVDLVFSVGGYANLTKRKTKCKNVYFDSFRIHYSFSENFPPTVLEYKTYKTRNMKWKNPRNHNFDIEYIDKQDVYGFTLDSKSQWYVTDNYIVTHNCGKSILAKYISLKWGVPLIRMDMGAIYGQYLGQSESQLREALRIAEANAPCILWIDEIEKAVGGGASESSGTSTRILGKLLTWLSERNEMVYVYATANNIDRIPSELLRTGRFDTIRWADLPTLTEAQEILSIHCSNNGLQLGQDDVSKLATICIKRELTGSEIEQAVLNANFDAAAQSEKMNVPLPVTSHFVEHNLATIKPWVESHRDELFTWRQRALNNYEFTSDEVREMVKKWVHDEIAKRNEHN